MKNRLLAVLFVITLPLFTLLLLNNSALAQSSPYFSYIDSSHEVTRGDTLEFFVIVMDSNATDILTITKEGPGDLATVPHTSPDTGFYSWDTESADTSGAYYVVFYVNDGTGNADTARARISVFIPDTIYVDCLEHVPAETTVTIDIRLWTDATVCGFAVPLIFYSPFNTDIVCDSVQWSSTFWANKPTLNGVDIDNDLKKVLIYGVYFGGNWPIGDDVLATLWLTTGATWDTSLGVKIDSTFYPPSNVLELNDCEEDPLLGSPIAFIPGCLVLIPTDVPETPSTGITGFVLAQNYPNPFNLKTSMSFEIPYECRVGLKIYNLAGRLVKTLVGRKMQKGQHTIFWDGTNSAGDPVASGVYFYRLTTPDFVGVKKMVLLK